MRLSSLVCSVVFFAITIFVLAKLDIPDSSIVIALIGALATFVVVGNYAQVKEIEAKLRSEVKQMKLLNEKLKTRFNEVEKEVLFAANETIGSVSTLHAENNYREGFYLNVIGNYIGAIQRHALIEQNPAFYKKDVKTLFRFLKKIDWRKYQFPDYEEGKIERMIADIKSTDCLTEKEKEEFSKRLEEISNIYDKAGHFLKYHHLYS